MTKTGDVTVTATAPASGFMPHSYHPIAGKLTEDELDRLLTGLRDSVARTAASLPDHAAYVAQYCSEMGQRQKI